MKNVVHSAPVSAPCALQRHVFGLALGLALWGCSAPGERALRRGNEAARGGQFEAARDAFADAVKARPGDARALQLLGNALYQLGRTDEAETAWRQALERDAQASGARLGLARLALERHEAAQALSLLEAAEAPDAPAAAAEALTLKGLALLERGGDGDAAAALETATDAEARVKEAPGALYVRGGALLALGRYSDSQAAFEALVRAHPTSPLGPYGLARLAAAQHRGTDVLLHLSAAKSAAGDTWKPESVAADPAFTFLSTSEGFTALVTR